MTLETPSIFRILPFFAPSDNCSTGMPIKHFIQNTETSAKKSLL